MAQAGYRVSKKYSSFPVGRVVWVKLRARTKDKGRFGYFDASDPRWQIRLRFAPFPLVTPVVCDFDEPMTKLVGKLVAGDTCEVLLGVALPTARKQLHVEWVAVETDVLKAGTLSGKAEHALDLPWLARAIASPTP